MSNSSNTDLRTASFIYRSKAGSFHEFSFWAKDQDDLNEKEDLIAETMMGAMTGSICGWADDDTVAEYRESVEK